MLSNVSKCSPSKKWLALFTSSWVIVIPFCSWSFSASPRTSSGGATLSLDPLIIKPEAGQGAKKLKSYIFAGGETLLNNFVKELRDKCTSGEYIPEGHVVDGDSKLTEGELKQRSRILFEKYYHIRSWKAID